MRIVVVHELSVYIYPRRRSPPRHPLKAKFLIFTARAYATLAARIKGCNNTLGAFGHEPPKVLPGLHPADKCYVDWLRQILSRHQINVIRLGNLKCIKDTSMFFDPPCIRQDLSHFIEKISIATPDIDIAWIGRSCLCNR